MVKIKWSDFMNPEKKIAINCQAEEDAKEFLQILDAIGVKWIDGKSLLNNSMFEIEGCDTSYTFKQSSIDGHLGLSYWNKDFYEVNGFTVYHYSEVEFMNEEQEKKELSTTKEEALYNIVKAMEEIRYNLEHEAGVEYVSANATAMKLLAEAFDIVSKA